MSAAVENAAVLLSCISLAYKESANCRLVSAPILVSLGERRASERRSLARSLLSVLGAATDSKLLVRQEAQYAHEQRVDMVPLMMEEGFRATGWLGLLVGARLYFNFHAAAIGTEAEFVQQIELVVCELGERGKPSAATGPLMNEGVPPHRVPAIAAAPAPASTPAPASIQSPAQAPAPVPAAAMVVRDDDRSGSFTPSWSSPSPHQQLRQLQPTTFQGTTTSSSSSSSSTDDASIVRLLLEREDKLRGLMLEREEKMEATAEGLRGEIEKLREALKPQPPPRIRDEQVAALQARLEALHAAELVTEAELDSLEDTVMDYVTVTATAGAAGDLALHSAAAKLSQLVAMSAAVATDSVFARQARRRFV